MSENKTLERSSDDATNEWRVGPGAWISLVVVLLVFSGLLFKVEGMAWLGAFDFTTLGGAFGTMKTPETNTFIGSRHQRQGRFLVCAVAGPYGDAGAGVAGNLYPLWRDTCSA